MPPRKVRRVAPPVLEDSSEISACGEMESQPLASAKEEYPSDWRKGALLNVRNHGAEYIVTLHPEEFDPRHEERCIKFTNLGECQDFVSKWYARESHDPRAR